MRKGSMRGSSWAPVPVDFSVRLYNWLLAAYPGRFRAEYGHHMAQVFRDVCRRDYRRGGLPAMLALWAHTSLDLARTTVEEHIERGIGMNREKFVRWSGGALAAAGVLFAAGLILGNFDRSEFDPMGGVDAIYEFGQVTGLVLGQILFVIGLLGLRAGYAGRSGSLGAALLLLAVIGSVVSLGGLLAMNSTEAAWQIWMGGYLVMNLSLAAFGIVAVRRRVFSRWNPAPILAGIGIPLLFGIGIVGVDSVSGSAPEWGSFLAVALTAVGLILIGYRMQADAGGIEPAA